MNKQTVETIGGNARIAASGATEDAYAAAGQEIGNELEEVSGGLPDLDAGANARA